MSTSGRAPWFSAIIRFWIRVESLNRPPTLLTISSSFSSSSIGRSASAAVLGQVSGEFVDGGVEVVVEDRARRSRVGRPRSRGGRSQAGGRWWPRRRCRGPGGGLPGLPKLGASMKTRRALGTLLADLQAPLDVDHQDDAVAPGQALADRAGGRAVQVAVDLGPLQELAPVAGRLERLAGRGSNNRRRRASPGRGARVVAETDSRARTPGCSRSRSVTVLLPAPEGPETTTSLPGQVRASLPIA